MSGAKKLLNDPNTCVDDCLRGLAAANPRLSLNPTFRVIVNTDTSDGRRVGIVSGGGSGHEPFPAGYVGCGMLTGAVCGSVFASPPSTNVLYAIRAVAALSPGGVLVLIPNYTGDMLNFGLAVEMAKAEGIHVDSLVVGDDIAQCEGGLVPRVGRRGMTGIVAVFKMAGSAASRGANLEQVKDLAAAVVSDAATIGLALNGGTLPGANSPLFSLGSDEMELGVGVHGEAGIRRLKLLPAAEAVNICLQRLITFLKLTSTSEVIVVVNNLGGMSHIEQWVIVSEIHQQLRNKQIFVQRTYAAPLFTSLDMPGIQICLIRIPENQRDRYLSLCDDATTALSWPGGPINIPPTSAKRPLLESVTSVNHTPKGPQLSEKEAGILKRCLAEVNQALLKNELRLNELDSGCGDGDCGTTLRNLAVAIQERSNSDDLNYRYPATLGSQLAAVAASTMGGTSGALYSLLLTNAADGVMTLPEGADLNMGAVWAVVWRTALTGVQKYSRARLGDRTMFDALEPALLAFEENVRISDGRRALGKAVVAAKDGCQATKEMAARAGRASYVEAARITEVDAGAFAVTVWLEAILNAVTSVA